MEIGFNNDTAYFTIQSDDVLPGKTLNISPDVISFSITEELKKFRTGSLTLRDPHHTYSRIFRNGQKFSIEWGYRALRATAFNSPPVSVRKGSKCVVQQPSGDADESGAITYKVTFFATEILKPREHRIFNTGTVADVVSLLMDTLGVTVKYINFQLSNTPVTAEQPMRQSETSYAMLFHLSQKYKCIFQIGERADGTKAGIFVDNAKVTSDEVRSFISGVTTLKDNRKDLYYNAGDKSNVRNYSWQQNIGEAGQGENIQIGLVNGETVFYRRVSETQDVKYWRLNPKKMKDALNERKTATEKTELLTETLNASTFEELQKYFDPVYTTTAPEGFGFVVNCDMIGDPSITPMMRVFFKEGFPAALGQNQYGLALSEFIIRQCVHTMTKSGYFTSVEIADLYTINGSFLQQTEDIGTALGFG